MSGVGGRVTYLTLHQQGESLLLCAAQAKDEGNVVPKRVHVIPAGELRTVDGRGPFTTEPAAKIMFNSTTADDRLLIDENHATELAAPR